MFLANSPYPVSERAVAARLNRRLISNGTGRLLRCRENSRSFDDLGRYYIVDCRNLLVDCRVHLEDLARELGVLRPEESLEG